MKWSHFKSLVHPIPRYFVRVGLTSRFLKVEVRGDSMAPTFNNGDGLLFSKFLKPESLIGRVILIERSSGAGKDLLQIKRAIRYVAIQQVDGLKEDRAASPATHFVRIWVEGDNKESSTDSRSWGAINQSEILGVLLFRYRRTKVVSKGGGR